MDNLAPVPMAELVEAALAALPGSRFLAEPVGLDWSPLRHLRATLVCNGEAHPVFIKRCRTDAARAAESYVCGELHPLLHTRTPALLATVETGQGRDSWLLLEDLGGRWVDGRTEDRCALLQMLGMLHGQGMGPLRERGMLPGPLRTFGAADAPSEQWESLLPGAVAAPSLGVEPWMVELSRSAWSVSLDAPFTLLHGDTDASNALCTDCGYALVDWEAAKIGPPPVDLGRAMDGAHPPVGATAYMAAFSAASGQALSGERFAEWTDLGDAYDALKWTCVYLMHYGTAGQPSDEWRRGYYEPSLERLRRLRERRPGWTTRHAG